MISILARNRATLAVFLILFQPFAHASATTADEVLKKSIQNIYTQSEQSTYLMRLFEADGAETQRKMKVAFKREGEKSAKLLLKFLDPAEIRGTGLLSIVAEGKPADQWLYLPAFKKTRRIRGGNENESFLGSDFTIGDITSFESENDRYQYSIADQNKPCGTFRCYVLVATPKAGIDSSALPYSKKVIYVRQDNFVGTRGEFYNSSAQLEKVLEFAGIHAGRGKSWVADRMEMENLLTGHRTVIEVQKRNASVIPSDSLFTQAQLERD